MWPSCSTLPRRSISGCATQAGRYAPGRRSPPASRRHLNRHRVPSSSPASSPRLQDCERATLLPSTLHLFWDLFGVLAREPVRIYMDAGTYAVARWGVERAAAQGVSVRHFPHHDASAARVLIQRDRHSGARPISRGRWLLRDLRQGRAARASCCSVSRIAVDSWSSMTRRRSACSAKRRRRRAVWPPRGRLAAMAWPVVAARDRGKLLGQRIWRPARRALRHESCDPALRGTRRDARPQ